MTRFILGTDGKVETEPKLKDLAQELSQLARGEDAKVVHGLLSPVEIKNLFAAVADLEFTQGRTGNEYNKSRTSRIAWLPQDHWISERMWGAAIAVHGALVAHEAPQVAVYGPEMHFDWHVDSFSAEYEHRLVTGVLELQSADGGALEIEGTGSVDLKPGDAVFFPSGTRHRATAPTQWMRFSITMWFGNPRKGAVK